MRPLPVSGSIVGVMPAIAKAHFSRAAADIGAHGDNDTLPFDIDNRFVKEKQDELALSA